MYMYLINVSDLTSNQMWPKAESSCQVARM